MLDATYRYRVGDYIAVKKGKMKVLPALVSVLVLNFKRFIFVWYFCEDF